MTIADGAPSESQITTEPTEWSRISWATLSRSASGPAVITPAVMISRSCTRGTISRVQIISSAASIGSRRRLITI